MERARTSRVPRGPRTDPLPPVRSAPPFPPSHRHHTPSNHYVLLMDRAGSGRVDYLPLDTAHAHPNLLPNVNCVTMSKLRGVAGYRTVVVDNVLYVLGGRHITAGCYLTQVYCYDPATARWSRRASLERGRTRFTATVLDGSIYLCGGEVRGGHVTDQVECYDPLTDTWTEVRAMPSPRADHAACAVHRRLVVTGGVEQHMNRGAANFWLYDPLTDWWTEAIGDSPLPQPLQRHCMQYYKGSLYCITGITTRHNDASKNAQNQEVFSFDCRHGNLGARISGSWSREKCKLTSPRSTASSFMLGHNIYIVGGYSYSQGKSADMIVYYDVRRRRWCDVFSVQDRGDLRSVDCCVLQIPATNKEFSSLGHALSSKWVLW